MPNPIAGHGKAVSVAALAAGGLVLAIVVSGCTRGNAGSADQPMVAAIQTRLKNDPAVASSPVAVSANNGVVTLSGNVPSESARLAAGEDAQVPGVTAVNNQIATTAAGVNPAPPATGNPATQMTAAQPVEVENGTAMHIRLDQGLSSATAAAGDGFTGRLTQAVLVNGAVVIPEGTRVKGTVVAADAAGHFKGQSRLELQLRELDLGGEEVALGTENVTRLSAARGKRSGEAIGGGAAVGALIGALAGHGKGAAIGAIGGAGAGTAAEALTKPPEVELPAETTLTFRLNAPIQVVPPGSSL